MLEGLDEVDWSQFSHAYGPADDVPGLIRALLSDEKTVWDRAFQLLFSTIWHQGTVYPATAHAVPFLIELLASPGVLTTVKEAIFYLLGCIADSVAHEGTPSDLDVDLFETDPEWEWRCRERLDCERDSARAARAAVEAGAGTYLGLLADADPKVRGGAIGMLALCKGRSAQLIPDLLARIPGQADPRFRAALLLAVGDLATGADDPAPLLALFADRMRPEEAPVVRLTAAVCLGRSSPGEPAAAILDILCETAPMAWLDFATIGNDTAGRVTEALRGDPAARLRVFLAAFDGPHEAAREGARYALERMCHERRSVTPVIAAALGARIAAADVEERRGLVQILAELGVEAAPAAGPLAAALGDDDPQVRTWAAAALAELRDPRAIPVMIERMRSERTFPFTARTLGGFGAEARAAVPALIDVLRTPPAEKEVGNPRIRAALALGRIGPDARPAIPALIALMENEPYARRQAAQAIGQIGGPEARAAIPALERLLRSPDESDRIRAAQALWRIDGRAGPALDVLRESLRPGSRSRALAAEVAGEMGEAGRGAVPAILDGLEDRSPDGRWVRLESAIALGRSDPRPGPTLPVLMDLLRDPGTRAPLATRAAQGLGEMGAAAHEAVPMLREFAAADIRPFAQPFEYSSDFVIQDEAFRSAIDEALRRIEGDLSRAGRSGR